MQQHTNKLSQFWQELKRRKVLRSLAIYAGTAFIILEASSIIFPLWNFPEWSINLVLWLLILGAFINVIIAWIYDITPGGMRRTKPMEEVTPEERIPDSRGWKAATYISLVVIVALIILNIIPRSNNNEILEKSIAVLPLEYLSEDPNKQYLANAVLDAITGHLSMIEGLRVMPRTSVEQYRENKKSAKEIGEELDVSYLIEGSFLMIENQVKLTIQLVVASEGDHVFFNEYDRNYEDIIAVQSEVAQTIAREIEVAITPEEKQLIEKIPTTNLTALDFYQRGDYELWRYDIEDDKAALGRAERLFYKALEHDSTYAEVYIGLADAYWYRNYRKEYFTENFLDSFLILTNIALYYDDQLAEAYRFRGVYYEAIGKPEQALIEYNKALEYNPGWRVYGSREGLGSEDQIQRIKDLEKANTLNQGPQKSISLRDLGGAYLELGFLEKGMNYYREALTMDRDSFSYLSGLGFAEFSLEHFEKALEIFRKLNELDSTFMPGPLIYNLTGHHQELYTLYVKIGVGEGGEYSGWGPLVSSHRIGVALWKMGDYEKAKSYFNLQIKLCNESIKLGRSIVTSRAAYYDLAGAYAWLGEDEKAIHYLNEYNKRQFIPLWWVIQTKVDPLFEPIRDKPEFQQIVKEVETKYQAEHERVRQWLEENDM